MENQTLYDIVDKLGFLEKKVLFLIKEKSKPRDILFLLNKKKKKYAYTTIMTVMDKLFKKGFLRREKIGKTYYYSLKISLKTLKNKTSFYLTKKLISLFSPLQILKHLTYLLLIIPGNNLINSFYNSGVFNGIYIFLFIIFLFNLFLNWHLNGFFEYLFLLTNEPSLLFHYLPINLAYFKETISSTSLFLIILLAFFFFKKIGKIRYQFKPF